MATDTFIGFAPQSTDDLIQSYENKLTQSIACKTLEASKKGTSPIFTKEETAYLNKKSQNVNAQEEISVITPAPIISLKKGKTEIQIKNATQILQKMDEKYPLGVSSDVNNSIPIVEKQLIMDAMPEYKPAADVKSINKNAYEIRTDVLSMALDWVKYKEGVSNYPTSTDETVLATAQKFYRFVENRR